MTKQKLFLLSDASADAKTKLGFGAYLILSEEELTQISPLTAIKTKSFEDTSSSKVELQTLLWALSEIDSSKYKVIIYTDCQNTIGLVERRERLEKNNYISKSNKILNNHELYKEFYARIDSFEYELLKIKGHKKKDTKDALDKIFTLVDKASRSALREALM